MEMNPFWQKLTEIKNNVICFQTLCRQKNMIPLWGRYTDIHIRKILMFCLVGVEKTFVPFFTANGLRKIKKTWQNTWMSNANTHAHTHTRAQGLEVLISGKKLSDAAVLLDSHSLKCSLEVKNSLNVSCLCKPAKHLHAFSRSFKAIKAQKWKL